MKKYAASAIIFATALVFSPAADAATITVNYNKITDNNVEDLSAQLSTVIYDVDMAFDEFGLMLGAGEVLFVYANNVGIASNIAETYVENDGTITAQGTVFNSLVGFTNFSGGSANPADLPGGNTVGFVADGSLSADVAPGPPSNGVNAAIDLLGISYTVTSFDDLENALISGDVRLGLHIRSIGAAGGSDAYVSLPPTPPPATVPEPGTIALVLAGLGLVGLTGGRRSATWVRRD